MALRLVVYTPGISYDDIHELSQQLVKFTGNGVSITGTYGTTRKRTAVYDTSLQELLKSIDITSVSHAIRLTLSAPIALKIVEKCLDILSEWAKEKIKDKKKKTKIQLYGPDGKLLGERDI